MHNCKLRPERFGLRTDWCPGWKAVLCILDVPEWPEASSLPGRPSRTTMRDAPVVLLTIAGFDPSSGAGITADIKTFSAHDCYGVACITALTVQSTSGVRKVVPTSAELV